MIFAAQVADLRGMSKFLTSVLGVRFRGSGGTSTKLGITDMHNSNAPCIPPIAVTFGLEELEPSDEKSLNSNSERHW